MEEVKLVVSDKGDGAFYLIDAEEQIGEMVASIDGSKLTVHHTEITAKGEGKGFAKKLLTAMVEHARKNELKVIPLCAYVHAQFKRRPQEYADVWNRDEH